MVHYFSKVITARFARVTEIAEDFFISLSAERAEIEYTLFSAIYTLMAFNDAM